MMDVARRAGVSTATVSRVLNSPGLVASETADRVHRVIQQLGYRPNVFAQGLMTNRSHLLGVLLPDIHGEFYSELIRGADAEARRCGYHLLVASEARVGGASVGVGGGEGVESLLNSSIVGFLGGLAVMVTEPNPALLRQAQQSGLPLVLIDEDIPGAKLDRICVDNRTGTYEAVTHLLERVAPGRCWFVGGPRENFDTAERAAAFAEVLAGKAGVRTEQTAATRVLHGTYDVEWGRKAGAELLKAEGHKRGGAATAAGTIAPIGVLAGNDEIAFGVMQAAAEMGVDVPVSLRVVGFDDTRLASLLRPGLSSVRVPMFDVGAAAIAALIGRVAEPDRAGVLVKLPTRLVVRGSSGG